MPEGYRKELDKRITILEKRTELILVLLYYNGILKEEDEEEEAG